MWFRLDLQKYIFDNISDQNTKVVSKRNAVDIQMNPKGSHITKE